MRHDGNVTHDWDLVTHAGFLTEEHQDANGLNTFVYTHEGSLKLWGLIRVVVDEGDGSRDAVRQKHAKMTEAHDMPGHAVEGVVPLVAGDVL